MTIQDASFHLKQVVYTRPIAPVGGFSPKNHGEAGLELVRHGSQLEPPDDIGRFLASLRFEQRGKLEQLGIEIDLYDL